MTDTDRLRLTIAGAAPAWARGPGRPSSSYLVRLGPEAMLLDLGQGSLGSLWQFRDPSTLAGIVVSHMHPDHHVDLVALRHLLRYGMGEPRRVPLWAPAGMRERYEAFMGEPEFLDAAFDGGEVHAGGWMVGHPERVAVQRVEDRARLDMERPDHPPARMDLAAHNHRISKGAIFDVSQRNGRRT